MGSVAFAGHLSQRPIYLKSTADRGIDLSHVRRRTKADLVSGVHDHQVRVRWEVVSDPFREIRISGS